MMRFSTSIIAKRAFTLTPEVWSSVLANLWRWIWSDCSFGPLPAPPPIPDQNGAIRYGWISLGGWRRNPRAGSEDPAFVLSRAGVFLSSQPVLHNVILSTLHARVAQGDPGRYWMAIQGDDIVGVVIQSPLTFPATLTPMERPVATAMADAIAEAGVALPGVSGEAATAATFAGQWSERTESAATPFQGNRLYELLEAAEDPQRRRKAAAGRSARAQPNDSLESCFPARNR